SFFENTEPVGNRLVGAAMLLRHCVEDLAPADCDHRRVLPNDEPIPGKRESRFFQPNLNECGFAGLKPVLAEEEDISHQLCGADVKANPLLEFNRLRRRAKQLKMAIEHRGWREKRGRGQDHSALHLCNVNALQVHGGSLARACLSGSMAVNLNT